MFSNIGTAYKWIKIQVCAHLYLNIILAYYLYILLTNLPIYYFDSPYKFGNNNLLNALSYFPVLLLVSAIPIVYLNIRVARQSVGAKYIRWLLPFNSCTYILVLALVWILGFI